MVNRTYFQVNQYYLKHGDPEEPRCYAQGFETLRQAEQQVTAILADASTVTKSIEILKTVETTTETIVKTIDGPERFHLYQSWEDPSTYQGDAEDNWRHVDAFLSLDKAIYYASHLPSVRSWEPGELHFEVRDNSTRRVGYFHVEAK